MDSPLTGPARAVHIGGPLHGETREVRVERSPRHRAQRLVLQARSYLDEPLAGTVFYEVVAFLADGTAVSVYFDTEDERG